MKKIEIYITYEDDVLTIEGTNLAHVNGKVLRVLDRALIKRVKKEKATLIAKEKADLAESRKAIVIAKEEVVEEEVVEEEVVEEVDESAPVVDEPKTEQVEELKPTISPKLVNLGKSGKQKT